MRRFLLGCLSAGALSLSMQADARTPSEAAVEAEVAELSRAAGGVVGVAAWPLDGTGPRIVVKGHERFPMASTFKVAVAGAVLDQVDAGRLSLEQMIAVEPDKLVPSEVIAERFIHGGLSMSVLNLLELMLTQSDNTATDVLVELIGGTAIVTGWLRSQGIKDQTVDRDTAGLIRDFFRLPVGPVRETLTAAFKADPTLVSKRNLPNPGFDADVRDTTTPLAMTELLERIFGGRALKDGSTKTLVEIMERCRTGEGRLKGRLPPGTVVAHKTGTIGGTVNDVGLITLPGGGQVVIAVFVKMSDRPVAQREAVIADIARSVRDYYLFVDVR